MKCEPNESGKWQVIDDSGRVIGEGWYEDTAMRNALQTMREETICRDALVDSVPMTGALS